MITSVRVVALSTGQPSEPARVALRGADIVFATRTQLRAVRGLVPQSAVVEVLADNAYDEPDAIRWDLPEDPGHVVVLVPRGLPSWQVAVALCEIAGRDRVELIEGGAAEPAEHPADTAVLPVMETMALERDTIERESKAAGSTELPAAETSPVEAGLAEGRVAPGRDAQAAADEAVIDVVGLGCSPLALAREGLSATAKAALGRASLAVGGSRHLAEVASLLSADAARLELTGDLSALDEVTAHQGRTIVLVSGDPGFFGVVRALRERLDPQRFADGVRVHPAVSSVSGAFAAAALPWDDALVVSAHGQDLAPAINACRRHTKVAVLTQVGFGLPELAAALGDRREYLVARRLGTAEAILERIAPGDAVRVKRDEDASRSAEDHGRRRTPVTPTSVVLVAATATGRRHADHLARILPEAVPAPADASPREAVEQAWDGCRVLVLCMATGAAVRLIAPLLQDRHRDPAVVTVDGGVRFAMALEAGALIDRTLTAAGLSLRSVAHPATDSPSHG